MFSTRSDFAAANSKAKVHENLQSVRSGDADNVFALGGQFLVLENDLLLEHRRRGQHRLVATDGRRQQQLAQDFPHLRRQQSLRRHRAVVFDRQNHRVAAGTG